MNKNHVVQEIMNVVEEFKEKHHDLKQLILTYFKEIKKHPEIQLTNHYKMLFELVSEVTSANLHISLLSHVHKQIDRNILSPKDYTIFVEYFKSLVIIQKEKLHLKILQLILSMIEKIDIHTLMKLKPIIEILSIIKYSPIILNKTLDQCIQRLVCKMQDFSQCEQTLVKINLEFLFRELSQQYAVTQSIQQERVFDESLILIILQELYRRKQMVRFFQSNDELNQSIYTIILRKYNAIQCKINLKKLSLELFVQMSFVIKNKTPQIINLLLLFAKENYQNCLFAINSLIQIYSRPQLTILIYKPINDIFKSIFIIIQQTSIEQLIILYLKLINQIIISIQNSTLNSEEQLDLSDMIICQLRPIMKNLRKLNFSQKVDKQWIQVFENMFKISFLYRVHTDIVLKLAKYSKQFFLSIIQKYDSYFEESEYWVIYHISFKQNYLDIYKGNLHKLELHMKALKKLLINSTLEDDYDQVIFTLNLAKNIIIQNLSNLKSISKIIQQICLVVFQKEHFQSQKLIIQIIQYLICTKQCVSLWLTTLYKVYEFADQINVKEIIIASVSELITTEGQNLTSQSWLSLLNIIKATLNQNSDILKKILDLIETIVSHHVHSFTEENIQFISKILIQFPVINSDVKNKYKICGLLWTIGEKSNQEMRSEVIQKLETFCYDETAEVAINGLCIYSLLGDHSGYQAMAKKILKGNKQSVIISYLNNYIKVVKRALTQQIYDKVFEFVINNLPQLYELNLNELIIESTIFHSQLVRLTVKEIFKNPEYFQLSLFFYVNYLSEKPKELKLVRYSIPKMMVQLMGQMVFLSSFQEFSQSIIFKDCIKLIETIADYPIITNEVFNLEKNKIYFEDKEIAKQFQNIYENLRQKQCYFTGLLKKIVINRQLLIGHSKYLDSNRIQWLEFLGKPQNKFEIEKYFKLFQNQEQVQYLKKQTEWGLHQYISVYCSDDIMFGQTLNKIRQKYFLEDLTFFLCEYKQLDSLQVIRKKAEILRIVLQKSIQQLHEKNSSTQIVLIKKLMNLNIHVDCLPNHKSQKGHLIYLIGVIFNLAITTDNNQIKTLLKKWMSLVAREMAIPY